jgi:hypothetical protein
MSAAERLIKALLTFTDHIVHNRPGIIRKEEKNPAGFRWEPVVVREEKHAGASVKMVYKPGFEQIGWLEVNGEVRAETPMRARKNTGCCPTTARCQVF